MSAQWYQVIDTWTRSLTLLASGQDINGIVSYYIPASHVQVYYKEIWLISVEFEEVLGSFYLLQG